MDDKTVIRKRDLECYRQATEEQRDNKLAMPERSFVLSGFKSEELQKELREFIVYKGKTVSLSSMNSEYYPYHLVRNFIQEEHPDLETFKDQDEEKLVHDMRIWLVSKGKTYMHKRKKHGKEAFIENDGIRFLRQVIRFNNLRTPGFKESDDKWYLDELPFPVRQNPVKLVRVIDFSFVKPDILKKQFKKVIKIHLQTKALGTVLCEMNAFKKFCLFFEKKGDVPEAFEGINRNMLEKYLEHVNTEDTGRQDNGTELAHLKGIFATAAGALDDGCIGDMFMANDITRQRRVDYGSYSENEMKRLFKAMRRYPQEDRALMLQTKLGCRISEVLMLRQDCVYYRDDNPMVRIYAQKTGKTICKLVDLDTVMLIRKAIEYTTAAYGTSSYIFVSAKRPDEPMQYGNIRDKMERAIRLDDVRDDYGNPLPVHTHYIRKAYGNKLADMGMNDEEIAKALGHSGTGSVRSYRKIKDSRVAKDTETTLSEMNKKIKKAYQERENGKA